MEAANAKICSSMERNLEGNLILMVLGFVRITKGIKRDPREPGSFPGPSHCYVTFLC